MTDAALVYAALRKSGLISNGCSGREIYLVYAIINNYANIFCDYDFREKNNYKIKVVFIFKILFKYSWL